MAPNHDSSVQGDSLSQISPLCSHTEKNSSLIPRILFSELMLSFPQVLWYLQISVLQEKGFDSKFSHTPTLCLESDPY